MWRLWFKQFGLKVVVLRTYDDEVLYRFIKPCILGKYSCRYSLSRRLLLEGGTSGYIYIIDWEEV